MVDILERLRLNEDDWVFGNTASTAKKEIISLRQQLTEAQKDVDRIEYLRDNMIIDFEYLDAAIASGKEKS